MKCLAGYLDLDSLCASMLLLESCAYYASSHIPRYQISFQIFKTRGFWVNQSFIYENFMESCPYRFPPETATSTPL